ncbi:MFS transporter [Paraburkholderia dipogonis]|uniref:MFS transporter n=2 Tax=Paraburkholderia dipogonis TaxID=1211383 RepID=UPI001AD7E787|nr:MFS transporter [Paraburkholderia dipogonis]
MNTSIRSNSTYERRAIALLALGFGLVGLDRWLITPLFPQMMRDLGLTYQDLGNVTAVLGLAWGVSAILMGRLSDTLGRRKILIPAIILFSLLSGSTGLVGGVALLMTTRVLMGITEGAYCPASFAAGDDASPPVRRGLNLGIIQGCFALFGLGLGPIIATQLLSVVPSWRIVFAIVAAPGLLLAFLMYRTIREPAHLASTKPSEHTPHRESWGSVLRYGNVRVGMGAIFCAMAGLFVLAAITPVYLTDLRHMPTAQMGFVMSGLGFGGFAGQIFVCGISDSIGRRNAAKITFLAGCASLLAFAYAPTIPAVLFALLFAIAFFCCGAISLMAGPVAAEAVPSLLTSSAVGAVVGAGEIFGGGVAPAIAGFIAQHMGLQFTILFASAALGAGFLLAFLLKETAPGKRGEAATHESLTTQNN